MVLVLWLACASAMAQDWVYRVRPGDTLWQISAAYVKPDIDWRRLQEHNQITDPYRLPPGLRLRIPLTWLAMQPAKAKVVALEGNATVVEGGQGQPQAVTSGMLLGVGSVLRTTAGASLSLQFADGSRLRLREHSELVLDRLSRYGRTGMADTRLRLQRGRISNDVQHLRGPGAQFIVDTPTASSAVRGTQFRVQADAADSRAEVLEGRVAVRAGQQSTLLAKGYGTVAHAQGGSLKAVALLPAPDLSALTQRAANDLRVRWPALERASAYRVQLSRQSDFASLVLDQRVDTPDFSLPLLPPDTYHLQVRGIDADGLEGHDARVSLLIDGQPEPPFVISPTPGSVVRQARPKLHWTGAPQAARYYYEVAADPDFTRVLARGESKQDKATVTHELQPGAYYWRVGSIDAQGKKGPFGDAIAFNLRPLEPVGGIERDAAQKADGVVFRWRSGEPGQRYRFQMARTPAFTDVRVDELVDQPQIQLDKLAGGTWYLRAQVVDANGEAGPFAEPQTVHIPCRLCRLGAGAALIVVLLSL